jgi:hypothetical protein
MDSLDALIEVLEEREQEIEKGIFVEEHIEEIKFINDLTYFCKRAKQRKKHNKEIQYQQEMDFINDFSFNTNK